MKGRTVVGKSSAPGKAILFGEQAVVHGATAMAAAVSDLRIEVDLILEELEGKDEVEVIFEDLFVEHDKKAHIIIPFSRLAELMPIKEEFSIDAGFVPDSELQTALQNEFSTYPGNVASGLITISFFVGYILLPCIDTDFSAQHRQLRVVIQSKGLPIGAGLGSSAAFSVATSAACFRLVTKLKEVLPNETVDLDQEMIERINSWAYSGEVLMHGNPSGLDNTTSSFGGLVSFVKDPTLGIQFSVVQNPPKMRILLVNTRVPRSTRQLVANVSALYHTHPLVVKPLFDSITEITKTFQKNIESLNLVVNSDAYDEAFAKFIDETGLLMDMNHHLLNALGVGHPSLTQVFGIAAAADCHAKLTGAGGGGCAIVLLPSGDDNKEKEEELSHLLRADGFDVFVSDIAGKGVQWHE